MENAQSSTSDTNGSRRQVLRDDDYYEPSGMDALSAAFKQVVADGEELLRATANYSAEGLAAARDKFQANLQDVKMKMREGQSSMRERANYATMAAQDYTRDNPWKALAIVGSIGMVIGLWMSRRR